MALKIIKFIFIPIILIQIPVVIYFSYKKNNTCDTRILMKDGTEYLVVRTFHTNDGMTWMKDCAGNEKSFPTVDIKTIEQINQ